MMADFTSKLQKKSKKGEITWQPRKDGTLGYDFCFHFKGKGSFGIDEVVFDADRMFPRAPRRKTGGQDNGTKKSQDCHAVRRLTQLLAFANNSVPLVA